MQLEVYFAAKHVTFANNMLPLSSRKQDSEFSALLRVGTVFTTSRSDKLINYGGTVTGDAIWSSDDHIKTTTTANARPEGNGIYSDSFRNI